MLGRGAAPPWGTFSGQGAGYSCRLAFTVTTGRYYRLRVWRLDADSAGQWWGAWIKDETTGVDHYVGRIRVATGHTLIAPPRNFSQYFGEAVSCAQVPLSVVYWTQPAANSQGEGVHQYGSTYAATTRAACTGGSGTPYDVGWTRGVQVVQGGPV